MKLNWKPLDAASQLDELKQESFNKPVVIFKHSTRCSISSTALDRLERQASKRSEENGFSSYFLDLLAYRPISNQIAEDFKVEHQSPQVLLIKNGACVYHDSHSAISFEDLVEKL